MSQQGGFVVQSAAIARELALGSHHAMAGHDDTDGIPTYRATYRLRGMDIQPFRDFPIGHGLPEWDFAYDIQYRLSKRCKTFHAVGWREIGLMACEINI